MKKILSVLIVIIAIQPAFSQATVKVTAGTTLKVRNGAHVVLNNINFQNDAVILQGPDDAVFHFRGTSNDTISGTGSTTLSRIDLEKNAGSLLTMQKNIGVISQVTFVSGLLNLDNYTLNLGTQGTLLNESENSRAMAFGSGYIQATGSLNAPASVNIANLGAVITSGVNMGTTIIRRGYASQPNVYGPNSSINRYFDIIPINNKSLGATLRLKYFDAELNSISEPTLALWKRNNTGTGWATLDYTVKDASANYVEKKGITSFSRMTLAQGCPVITAAIPNAFAVSPGSAANTIYIGYGATSLTLKCNGTGGTAPYSYRWSIGQTTQSITVAPNAVGTYTYNVAITDEYGCSSEPAVSVVNVVDVRCGPKLDKVTVCVFNKGAYTTNCVLSNAVSNYLANGSYLGECGATSASARLISTNKPPEPVSFDKKLSVKNSFDVTASPNPSTNYFTLKVESTNTKNAMSLRVVDVLDRVIETRTNIAEQNLQIGNNYKPGVYIVEVIQGNNKKLLKLIKL